VGNNPLTWVDPTGLQVQALLPYAEQVAKFVVEKGPVVVATAVLIVGLTDREIIESVGNAASAIGNWVGSLFASTDEATVDDVRDKPKSAVYVPVDPIPQGEDGEMEPSSEYPHSQLGTERGRRGNYPKAREWGYDEDGNLIPTKDIDFTDHGRPSSHPDNPHQHKWNPNSTGGTPQRGPAEPLTAE